MIQLFDIKTRTLGFAFCQPPKKSLPKSYPKKVLTKISHPKKSSDRRFQTQKRASHIPVTYIPEYPPGEDSEKNCTDDPANSAWQMAKKFLPKLSTKLPLGTLCRHRCCVFVCLFLLAVIHLAVFSASVLSCLFSIQWNVSKLQGSRFFPLNWLPYCSLSSSGACI